jgi:hypothetical protein
MSGAPATARLAGRDRLRYSSSPRCDAAQQQQAAGTMNNKEFDEQRKIPHNLSSLLLTNKTICR